MKKIANAQGLCDFLFSGRPQAGYYLGFRESGHARRDTVERSGRIFTRWEIAENKTGGGEAIYTRIRSKCYCSLGEVVGIVRE